MSLLRVGRICALNMYPIYHHLERLGATSLDFTDGLPTDLNGRLLDGRLDVSAMSSIAYARNAARLRLLPVASISCEGAVDSIQLFSRVPFREVRTVALTPHSASSVTLLRILLGPSARFSPLESPPAEALEQVDGVLLIADEALRGLVGGLATHNTDLGEEWRARTGLPMVFAVWAAREEAVRQCPGEVDRLTAMLREAREAYAADPEAVVAAAAERFPFPDDFIRAYLTRLSYAFGPSEQRGLARFLELARAAGELDALPRQAA